MASYHDGALGLMLSVPYVPLGVLLVILAFSAKRKKSFLWIILSWALISLFCVYIFNGAEDSVSENIILTEFLVISFLIFIPLIFKIIKDDKK